jgi:hypothetical protein
MVVTRFQRPMSRARGKRPSRRPLLQVERLDERILLNFDFQPVAFSGDPAPGGGTFTVDFEPGGFNIHGQAVFAADLADATGQDIGEGVFLARHSGLRQLARIGEPAPGGGTFGGALSLSPPAINEQGNVAFAFGLDPLELPIGVNAGVYRYTRSTHQVSAVVVPGVTGVPGGGTFAGANYRTGINEHGDVVFSGTEPATIGPGASIGLGHGVFEQRPNGRIRDIVAPGDPVPGGGTFDFAQSPSINDHGDVAFGAHVEGEPILDLGQTLPEFIFAAESVYVKIAATGHILSIAHQGGPIPASAGGGVYDFAFGPVVNNQEDVLFIGALSNPPGPAAGDSLGLFLWSDGRTRKVARPGDTMPGGGHLLSASFYVGNYSLNKRGDIAFNALLDDGGQGLYIGRPGDLTLVARTGTEIPGVGTVESFDQLQTGFPSSGVVLNDRGQLLFGAQLTDGRAVLLVANSNGNDPAPGGSGGGTGAPQQIPAGVAAPAATLLNEVAPIVPEGSPHGHHPNLGYTIVAGLGELPAPPAPAQAPGLPSQGTVGAPTGDSLTPASTLYAFPATHDGPLGSPQAVTPGQADALLADPVHSVF